MESILIIKIKLPYRLIIFSEEDEDLSYFLIGKDLSLKHGFLFLSDLKIDFLKSYKKDKINKSLAYSLKSYDDRIKKLIDFHSKSLGLANKDNLINETNIAIIENRDIIKENKTKTNIILNKSNKILDKSKNFAKDVNI